VEAAKAALAINPHDPATNEELGKFYCIEKEDWDAGLRLLAKCGNEDLKRAAQLDLKPPANKTEEAALAHQWLDFANSERDRTTKQRFQLRGRYWFLKARPSLPRDVQTALQERIDKIPLFADRVIIWNQHNYIHKDRGSEACVVTLLRNGKKVSQKSISLKWKPAAPASTTLRIRRQRVDAIRVDVTKYRGLGGGLGEVEVYDGSINISRYTSAVGSQYFHNEHKYHPNQVTDGNSSGHRGFWILPDGKTGWVMIDFYRLLPDH